MDSCGGKQQAKDFWKAVNVLYFDLNCGYKDIHFKIFCKHLYLCFMYFFICGIFQISKVLKTE